MGDRAVIQFSEVGDDIAAIYLHFDGSEADRVLGNFFAAEQASQRDNRFGDAEYLAARFVAWRMDDRGTGVGIVPPNRMESSNWRVHCDSDAVPRVEQI